MIRRLYNKRIVLPYPEIKAHELLRHIDGEFKKRICENEKILRWAITGASKKKLSVEMVIAKTEYPIDRQHVHNIDGPARAQVVVHIVPTGVRASIGGYIGDATPVTNLLAATTDYIITNPNTVNAAMVNYALPNVLYVEGYALDQFFAKHVLLEPKISLNRIGLLIDKAGAADDAMLNLLFCTADTCRIAGGMNISAYALTKDAIGGTSFQTKSGAFSGEIKNPSALLAGAQTLIKENQLLDAIAVTTHIRIPKNALTLYHQGHIPDPHGGLEAVISHFLSWQTKKMVAHAPILARHEIEKMLFNMKTVEPRAAGEIIGAAGFLGCVFSGLSRSPRIHWLPERSSGNRIATHNNMLGLNNVIAIVAPYNALGGFPMLVAAEKNIPIIAVRENETLLTVTKDALRYGKNVVEVDNYYQAAALIASLPFRRGDLRISKTELSELNAKGFHIAQETGIDLSALQRPVHPFKEWGKIT